MTNKAFERRKAQQREIDALKEKCEQLLNEKWDAQDDLDCYYDEMQNKIKQAKIEALKDFAEELKKKMRAYMIASGASARPWVLSADYVFSEIDCVLKEYEK